MNNKIAMQIYLTQRQKEFLAEKSERTGIPQAEMIRRAINEYIRKEDN